MIIAYFAYGICALAVGIGVGFIVAKIVDIFETKKMTKADEIEARR